MVVGVALWRAAGTFLDAWAPAEVQTDMAAMDGEMGGDPVDRFPDERIESHIPVFDKSKRTDGTFSREDFAYDRRADLYICPDGKVLRQRQKIYRTPRPLVDENGMMRYRADRPGLALSQLRFAAARPLSEASFPIESGPDTIAVAAELNNDDRPELITYDGAGDATQIHSRPPVTSTAQDPLDYAPTGSEISLGVLEGRRPRLVYAEDFDYDGWNDLLISGGGHSAVLFNDGTGAFPAGDAVVLSESFGPVARAAFAE